MSDFAFSFIVSLTTALAIWYAIGVYATWVDTREDDEPERDPLEPR